MIRMFVVLVLLLGLTIASHVPVSAGGVATVHLDEVPTGIVAGQPVTIGFTVMQHDVTPVNVESAILVATHRRLGETVRATAEQSGPTGHYVVDVTFPTAGSWKWSIIPAPFAGTSFESLEVTETGLETPTLTAELRSGTCLAPDVLVTQVDDLLGLSPSEDGSSSPVEVISAGLEMGVRDLTIAPHALLIVSGDSTIACADMTGTIWDSELVVGIHEVSESGASGIATVAGDTGSAELTIYLSVAGAGNQTADVPASDEVIVEIIGSKGSWSYSPARVEVPVGGTVTWVNTTTVSHTVTGTSMVYEDSSPILAGESWSQTFLDVGTFDYFCSPHPFMTGAVTMVQ